MEIETGCFVACVSAEGFIPTKRLNKKYKEVFFIMINGRVRASAAVKQKYFKRLMSIIDEMNNSVNWWLGARYKENEKEIVANDIKSWSKAERVSAERHFEARGSKGLGTATECPTSLAFDSAAGDIEKELKDLMKRWSKRFDEAAKDIAKDFVKSAVNHSTNNLKELLKKAGWTTNLKLSRKAQDKLKALVLENINLIKSIEKEYFTQLTTITMESITRGRDLKYLKDEIKKRYGVVERRAALIARDQNNKATSIIIHTEYEELGITEAIWKHNPGSKEPRHEHVAANNKVYDIKKGMFFESAGRHVFPGEEINCGCTSEPIIPEIRGLQLKRIEER